MDSDLEPFDPEWLATEEMMGGRQQLPVEPAVESRKRFDALFDSIAPLLPKPDDSVEVVDVTVPASEKRIRVYKPTKTTHSALPVGLYIHSGGWYAGSIENEDFVCRNLASNSQIILYSPDYRLAPEDPFPAGFEDVCAAYEYMHETASSYGGDPTRKYMMGGSAGGNLTLAVALHYATNPELKASGLFPFVPGSCDIRSLPEEYKKRLTPEKFRDSPIITNELVPVAREWLNAPPTDPRHSVLLHPDIKHLPPCYIAVCTKDPVYQESVFFWEECKKQGVEAELAEWMGMPHFFWVLPMCKKSHEFIALWNEKLRAMIDGKRFGGRTQH